MKNEKLEAILEGLNDGQKEAVSHIDGACCVIASAGSGKALKNSTKVQTFSGQKEIGELSIGDTIIGADGLPTKVIGVYPQGKKQVYEVEFNDGNIIECCNEHLWTIQTASMRTRNNSWKTLSLQQIIDTVPLYQQNEKNKRNNCYIPMCEPVQYEKKTLPLDPYLLGALLGDGSISGKASNNSNGFTNPEKSIVEKVDFKLRKLGCELRQRGKIDYYIRCDGTVENNRKNQLKIILRQLGLQGTKSENKFIPKDYLYSNI